MAEESQFLTFMGIRVHYTVALPEAPLKHRVLLLCSPLMTTFHWRKLLPELSELGCLAVAADLPGFGRSDCTSEVPQSHDMRANMLWGILDEVDRETGAPMSLWHLVGHGSACATLLRMVNQYPDSVRTQVMINPLFEMDLPAKNRKALIDTYNQTVQSQSAFNAFIAQYSVQPLDAYVLDRMRRPLLRQGARENFVRMLSQIRALPDDRMGFCPTMALYGNRDPLMDSKAMIAMRRYLPDAEMHALKSAGHFPMETHSKALRDYLRGWIRWNNGTA
ncbi:MAG: alpha/beta fold hydrolase [Clostridia bacterium]|nr:alpha/beta fold hydrolase [Clostridia bacterium]